ncbi:MAG: acylphosphatase [Armatimonadota bacterium]|nr:acylphosphatase [Armatimonadota bacterium]MDR7450385.1 acylphosphatase [Armatimonadota bacterium]MDR7467032.1 acylphosphatase [Armatimonadota bacterium]MDR7493426.1 acylphosphatase [Armatimonadota bacterium]MDR7498691.1 acylphosphatase [Armatimonadota bacterium]
MTTDPVRAHLWISGVVQGVGFRFFAVRAARRHGVSGFVRNLPDGRVEVEAEGPREMVLGFIAEMQRGPAGAVVAAVDVQWEPPAGRQGFVIQ